MELAFGSTVSDPLKPLRDEMNDGKLGSFTVDRQLDVKPTTEPITLSPSRKTECKWVKFVDQCYIIVIIVNEKLYLGETFSRFIK